MAAISLCSVNAKPTLYTCGDSTMANYATDGSTPTRGWGQYFGSFFTSDINVVNYGKGGMDVQNFYENEKYWPEIKSKLQPGDFVLIQFAHNDEKNGGMDGRRLKAYYESIGDSAKAAEVDLRGSVPAGTYRETLSKIIDEVRGYGATPILATPICRLYFSGNDIKRNGRHDLGDNFDILTPDGPSKGHKLPADDHSMDYRFQMIRLAGEKNVDFIDMTEATRTFYTTYGKDAASEIIFDGLGSTHLSVAGAILIARRAAELMMAKNILSEYIDPKALK